MKTLVARPQRVAPPAYGVRPLAEYEAWLGEYLVAHPKARTVSASIMRRVVMLRNAGDSFAEVARCCGLAATAPKVIYDRLPERLK